MSAEGEAVNEWESLELGLQYLLGKLLPKMELIRSYISKYDVFWWCGHFQSSFDGGPTMAPRGRSCASIIESFRNL
jgi:hypothetical protein